MNYTQKRVKSVFLAAAAALLLTLPALSADFTDADAIPHPEAVNTLVDLGILSGMPDGSFTPDAPADRAQMANMISLLLDPAAAEEEFPASGLTDVSASWAAQYIDHCCSLGLISGYGDGTFRPNKTVTGTETAKMLLSAAGFGPFSGSDWAEQVNEMAVGAGLYRDFDADPSAPLTRDGAALLLYNALALLGEGTMRFPGDPTGIASLPDGSLLVTDGYHRAVYLLRGWDLSLYAGEVNLALDVSGQPLGGYYDGLQSESTFQTPWAIAPFLDGWAVSDPENNVVRLIANGQVQTINPTLVGEEETAAISHPTGLAAGPHGSLYIADTFNGRICQVMPDGTMTIAAEGLDDPMGLCWQDGVLYIAEAGAHRIMQLADGKLTLIAGSGEEGNADGHGAAAGFSTPRGIAIGPDGVLYISDPGNSAVRRIENGNVTTILIRKMGSGANVPLSPTELTVHGNRLYVCDPFAEAILIMPIKS